MTKKALKEKCRIIAEKGNPVNAEDQAFLLNDVFPNHLWWFQKSAKEIDHVYVANAKYGTKGFRLKYTDGSDDDISYYKAINRPKAGYEVHQTLRSLIEPQIKAYRSQVDISWELCGITGKPLPVKFHIDHIQPFNELADAWMKENNQTVGELLKLIVDAEQTGESKFSDEALNTSWCEYHLKHAQLQPTTPKANLKKGAKNE